MASTPSLPPDKHVDEDLIVAERACKKTGATIKDYVIMALIAMIFMIVGLMIGDDRPPRYQIQGSADRSIYLPGDTITFSWDFELLRDCWGWTTRRLILPNRVVNLPERIWDYQHIPNRELPRFMTFSIGVFLPIENVEAGTGYYDITGHYVCNPLQNLWPITVDFPVIPFLITTNN